MNSTRTRMGITIQIHGRQTILYPETKQGAFYTLAQRSIDENT